VYSAFNLPFAVWLMYSFIRDIPIEVEEAATVDGASRFRMFWSVIMPLVKSGLVVTMLFVFIFAWNEFQFALVLTHFNAETLPRTLIGFVERRTGPDWGLITALSLVMMIPVIITAAILHRHLARGLTFGAVRG